MSQYNDIDQDESSYLISRSDIYLISISWSQRPTACDRWWNGVEVGIITFLTRFSRTSLYTNYWLATMSWYINAQYFLRYNMAEVECNHIKSHSDRLPGYSFLWAVLDTNNLSPSKFYRNAWLIWRLRERPFILRIRLTLHYVDLTSSLYSGGHSSYSFWWPQIAVAVVVRCGCNSSSRELLWDFEDVMCRLPCFL